MNARISLPELSRMIADSTGFDIKACELFVRELFATVAETIVAGENVKVKGIGTFKSTTVEQRKSVNVNTGEQMIIPEHRKVSFTPDKALAEAVNAPFSMFEPVELNDDVSDEMLESAGQDSSEDTVPTKSEDLIPDTSVSAAPGPEPETENATHLAKPEPEFPETDQESENESEAAAEPEALDETHVTNPEPIQQSVSIYDDIESENGHKRNDILQPDEYEESCVDYGLEPMTRKQRRRHFGRGFIIGVLCAIALICIGLLSWRLIIPESFDAVISVLTADNHAVTSNKDVAAKTVGATKATANTPQKSASTKQAPPITPVENDETADVPTETSDKQIQVSESGTKGKTENKPEVFTDKITKKRYLTTMAREYYGNYNLWPLIYDYNKKLGHPDRIRPGTKIQVPSAEALGIDTKDPAVIKRAKNRGVEIYNKYKKS